MSIQLLTGAHAEAIKHALIGPEANGDYEVRVENGGDQLSFVAESPKFSKRLTICPSALEIMTQDGCYGSVSGPVCGVQSRTIWDKPGQKIICLTTTWNSRTGPAMDQEKEDSLCPKLARIRKNQLDRLVQSVQGAHAQFSPGSPEA